MTPGQRIAELFHLLWGKAHDGPDYVKAEWCELQDLLAAQGLPTRFNAEDKTKC